MTAPVCRQRTMRISPAARTGRVDNLVGPPVGNVTNPARHMRDGAPMKFPPKPEISECVVRTV
ncbi:hypothetical protein I546_5368 [Mycobacterium kansasii 732]|nr:hypothetical protein I546_5368 [Mycobacterium kansasii 732]